MKTCPFCRTDNDDVYRFCRQCGQQLDSLVLSADEPVVAGASTLMITSSGASRAQTRRTVPLATLFAQRRELVIGRAPDCDVCLQHPSVSRYHALLVRVEQGVQVSDLSSINGVHVNGRRITTPVLVRDKEIVGIGPFLFTLLGETMQSLDSSRSLRLEARGLEKQVTGFDGKPKKLLDNINLVLQPGEFVSLLGPSGSGKSTLMDCLNGRRRATGGQVLANGEDFYLHFDSFRQLLGYVPQKDIVHGGLTVHHALYYTARLRLPTDTDRTELNARVEDVLKEMELLPHRNTLVADLSGGQIKRVSLGAELLAQPCLLYIDEATSGLDAGTEARMMRLFRRLADEGRSLICITHNIDNVDRCHLILVLARGKLLFYGPPGEAPAYFGVKRLSEVYDRLQERDPDEWEKQFCTSKFYADYVVTRLATSSPSVDLSRHGGPTTNLIESREAPAPSKKPLLARKLHEMYALAGYVGELIKPVSEHWHQLKVLTRRYAHLVWSDPRSLRLLFLQAPVIALFLLIGFVNKPYEAEVPATRRLTSQEQLALRTARDLIARNVRLDNLTPEQQRIWRQVEELVRESGLDVNKVIDYLLKNEEPVIPSQLIVNPTYTYMLLSITCLAVLWFGCNNAAKEIVKEEPIYSRERAVNLRIAPYLGSKFIVLMLISAVQTFFYMVVMYGVLEALHAFAGQQMPPREYMLDYPTQYGVLLLLAMSGVALGLLLSACVASADRANALLPYVLIPQMILGGGVIAIRQGAIYWLAVTLSPVYWAYRGIRRGESELPPDFFYHMSYDDGLWIVCTALLIQTAVLLLMTAWFLKRKDAH